MSNNPEADVQAVSRTVAEEMLDAATAAAPTPNGATPAIAPDQPEILRHMTPSGLKAHYVLEMADGGYIDVRTNAADVLRYETVFKRGWFDESGVSLTRLLYTAWAALERTGHKDLPKFAEFRDKVIDVHLEPDAQQEVDPTQRDLGGGL